MAWIAGLTGLLALMIVVGHGALAAPDVRRPSTWAAWAEARTAPDAVMAVLRLVVLAVAAYLLVVTALAVALRLGDAGRAVTVADVVTLPFVRSVVHAGLGVGLVGATVAGVAAQPSAAPRTAPTSADAAIVAADPPPPPTIVAVPDASRHEEVRIPDPDVTRTTAPRTWTVEPGDHLWSIAERALASSLGRTPSEGEVVPYWQALVSTNRPVLADPDNPDLIYAGQVLTLPQ